MFPVTANHILGPFYCLHASGAVDLKKLGVCRFKTQKGLQVDQC